MKNTTKRPLWVTLTAVVALCGCGAEIGEDSSVRAAGPAAPEINSAPSISGTPDVSVAVGALFSFTPTASDPDGDRLTFTIDKGPEWLTFDRHTGRLSGVPRWAGRWGDIRIFASDGWTSSSLPAFEIVAVETEPGEDSSGQAPAPTAPTPPPAPNSAPSISGTPDTSIPVGTLFSFTPTASDPDGDTLTFTIENRPGWLTLDHLTGRASGVPQSAGSWSDIRIFVSDGQASASLPAFEIVATQIESGEDSSAPPPPPPTNSAPSISGTPDTTIVVGGQFSFTPTASDPDRDSLTFAIQNRPGWLTFDQQTGRLSGVARSAGSWGNIRIFVSDGQASASLPAFEIVATQSSSNVSSKLSTNPPRFQEWLDKMQTYGHQWGQSMDPSGGESKDSRLTWQYYDGQWIFQQIGEYLGEAEPWATYADYAEQVYRDEYLEPNYYAQGYRRFPHGLYYDYLNGGDTTLVQINKLRDTPSFSNLSEYHSQYTGTCQTMSREVAYLMQALVVSEWAGAARKQESGSPMLETLIPWMEAYFHQWKSGGYDVYAATCAGQQDPYRFAPFMAGLAMHALIEFYDWEVENARDPNAYWAANHWADMETMIEDFLEWMYFDSLSSTGQRMWVDETPDYGTFRYESHGTEDPAWDLNNLIAPAYAWLGLHYANGGSPADIDKALLYFDIGDRIFAGSAVNAAVSWNGKQFNQAYRWSFEYVQWRNDARALMPE